MTFAGGPEYAVVKAAEVGANSFSFFLKSKPVVAPYTPESIEVFKQAMKEFKYSSSDVLPHGYNQINLGSPYQYASSTKFISLPHSPSFSISSQREQAYSVFLDDLRRCEQLELSLYNFQ
ncbi:hypothetical protein H0H93_011866 [Arthromyces matolae]|nr:hypothetical protein H0H93_011866 [Arthromyces matolae]